MHGEWHGPQVELRPRGLVPEKAICRDLSNGQNRTVCETRRGCPAPQERLVCEQLQLLPRAASGADSHFSVLPGGMVQISIDATKN